MRQMTLATNGFEKHRKQTRKVEFLPRMDKLVPWAGNTPDGGVKEENGQYRP